VQVFSAHLEAFWLFFLVDAREAMYQDDSIVAKLQLFHMVNQYFCSQGKTSTVLCYTPHLPQLSSRWGNSITPS